MTIRRRLILREGIDIGRVRLGDVASRDIMPLVTLGEVLREEFFVPMGLSATRLAREIGVPTNLITCRSSNII